MFKTDGKWIFLLVACISIASAWRGVKDPWPEDDDFGMEMIHDAREDAIRRCQENCKREVSRKHGSNWAVFYYSRKCSCGSGSTDSDPRSFNHDTVYVHEEKREESYAYDSPGPVTRRRICRRRADRLRPCKHPSAGARWERHTSRRRYYARRRYYSRRRSPARRRAHYFNL
ncbi:uncharacterized protein LOC135694972 [Rhopilema esculentum]|uniref:uncharacterized protein LOC135694972 n=1 Tax=Rhopilema esculentum TaxID=499914 RepID=UPI0031D4231B